jgi:hypothetical protein
MLTLSCVGLARMYRTGGTTLLRQECKTAQTLEKTLTTSHKMYTHHLTQSIYPRETKAYVHTLLCYIHRCCIYNRKKSLETTQMFINRWITIFWGSQSMEYYSAVEKKVSIHTIAWMNLNIMVLRTGVGLKWQSTC